MFESIMERLRDGVSPSAIIACLALVLAIGGGAALAKGGGGLTAKQKKQVEQIAKKYAGKNGAPGAQGPQGPKGDSGAPGTNGINGKDGVSVTSAAASLAECPEGGTKFTSVSGTSKACNGAEGSPWTAGGTLPEGATLTGVWGGVIEGAEESPISFELPLSSAPEAFYIKEPGVEEVAKCPGIVGGIPTAAEGVFCMYKGTIQGTTPTVLEPTGVGPSGAFASVQCTICIIHGTWAVTGP